MKILGIVRSMRKKGNTNLLMTKVLKSAQKAKPQLETEILRISELRIESCRACYESCSKEPYKCVIDDDLERAFEAMRGADGIVIGFQHTFETDGVFGAARRSEARKKSCTTVDFWYD